MKKKPINKFSLTILVIVLMACIMAFYGCSPAISTTIGLTVSPTGINAGGGLAYVNNPLPVWTAGKFNAALLEARGGVSPYTWTLKEGSRLPEGFMLYSDGKFTGTPPLLSANTDRLITPPFTIVLTDSAGRQIEVELNVTIVSPDSITSGNKT